MIRLSDMLWLGRWGTIFFLLSVVCLVTAVVFSIRKENGSALLYLVAGWAMLALSVVGAATGVNHVVDFIRTKQMSPQFTPVGMLFRIWGATAITITVASVLSLPVLIKGVFSTSDGKQRKTYVLAVLATILFACANIIALILTNEMGKYPYPYDEDSPNKVLNRTVAPAGSTSG